MGDNTFRTRFGPTIAGFDASCTPVVVGGERIALWAVADLERHVDRAALLRADDPPEPPYWAHCWSGARVLAEQVPSSPGRVLEIGCGLGLPGLVAARRGGRVLFVDRVAAPLAFVRASLRENALDALGVVLGDMLDPPCHRAFDLVLAAEVLYDRAAFPRLAGTLAGALAPGGSILLADAHRIDTAAFYAAATETGLAHDDHEVTVLEEGFPTTVTVVTMRRRGEAG
jgi:predicted nicotinamide N-methyase